MEDLCRIGKLVRSIVKIKIEKDKYLIIGVNKKMAKKVVKETSEKSNSKEIFSKKSDG